MIKTFNYLFVTCFGIGSFRFAPGTITSFATTIFLFSLFHIINLSNNIILIGLILIFLYSFYAVSEYIKDNENKELAQNTANSIGKLNFIRVANS